MPDVLGRHGVSPSNAQEAPLVFGLGRMDQGGRSCAPDIIVSLARPGQNPCLGDPDYRTSLHAQGSGEPKFAPIDLLARADILASRGSLDRGRGPMEPPSHLRTASHTPGERRPRRKPGRAENPWPGSTPYSHVLTSAVPGFACADVMTDARLPPTRGPDPPWGSIPRQALRLILTPERGKSGSKTTRTQGLEPA